MPRCLPAKAWLTQEINALAQPFGRIGYRMIAGLTQQATATGSTVGSHGGMQSASHIADLGRT